MNQYKIIRKAPALFIIIKTSEPTFRIGKTDYKYDDGGYPVSRHRTKASAQELIDELELRKSPDAYCADCGVRHVELYMSRYRLNTVICSDCGYGENLETHNGPYVL